MRNQSVGVPRIAVGSGHGTDSSAVTHRGLGLVAFKKYWFWGLLKIGQMC